jgi:butyrate kinase
MEKTYRILAVNPGSTSTKVALFDNDGRYSAEYRPQQGGAEGF